MSTLHVRRAGRVLRAGGLIGYPTEGVYGLGCLPLARGAVERLLAIKSRSWRKGFVLVAADLAQVTAFARLPPEPNCSRVLASWPGPVTWLLDAQPGVPHWITGGQATVAMRVSAHPLVRALCETVGSPLISTSANRGGRPPLRRLLHVRREFGAVLDDILPGVLGTLGGPTTIRDARSERVIRGA
jgi:L-threonylcarbamoyladenylate synthase